MTVITQSASCCDPDDLDRDVTDAPPPRSSTFRISLSRMFSLIEEYAPLDGGDFQDKKRVVNDAFENSSGVLNCDQSKRFDVEVKLESSGPCFVKNESYQRRCEEYLHQNSEGDTKLHVAIVQQLPLLVYDLVRLVPHPSYLDIKNDDAQTALHVAVITRQADVICWLLDAGADPMRRDSRGNTALHLACQIGEMNCVKALTRSSRGRDAKALVMKCQTKELTSTCQMLDVSSAKELQKRGKFSKTLYQMRELESYQLNPSLGQTKAAVNPCQVKKTKADVKLYQKHEAKVPTTFYQTADVRSAKFCQNRDLRCAEGMENQCFEVNGADFFEEQHSVMSVAKRAEILPEVRRASFSPQELAVVNYEGETVVHVAVNHGHLGVLRWLVECGADVNAREARNGNTVLHVAVERGIVCCYRYLLEEGGSKLDTRNYAGQTVHDLACDVNPSLAAEIARKVGGKTGSVAKKRENKVFRQSGGKSLRKGKS